MRYKQKDFEKVAHGEVSPREMAQKYGVSYSTFMSRFNRSGYYICKHKFRITSPHMNKIVYSYSAVADELCVSEQTIRNYLKGKRIKTFEDLGIKIEVVEQ